MSASSLTQPFFCLFFLCACGKDPILQAVEEMEEGKSAVSTNGQAGPEHQQEPPPGNEAGEPMSPGIPEEPEPGIPGDPTPGKPGTPDGTPGNMGMGDSGRDGQPVDPQAGVPVEPKPGVPDEPQPAEPGSPPPAGGEKMNMPKGVPDEPSPAPPGSPGGSAHKDKQEQHIEGPQVRIRGRISASQAVQGAVRIDVFDGDHRDTRNQMSADKRINHILVHELERPSWFEISVPVAYKRVWIGAYGDLNDNKRPDRGEPVGWFRGNPVQLSDTPPTVLIDLVVETKATGLGLDFGGQ